MKDRFSLSHTPTLPTTRNYTELMSEEKNNQPNTDPAATQPIKKTSAVPLRKETVRVTLKAPGARPGGAPAGVEPGPAAAPTMSLGSAAKAPKSLSSTPTAALAPPQTAPLSAPSAPATTNIDLPDVTSAVPLKQETMRVTLKADRGGPPVAPAPTIPLGGGSRPPAAATPAPTMRLGGAPTVPLATQSLATPTVALGGAVASQPLPKATVELQSTQQLTQGLGGPAQAAAIQVSAGDEAQRGSSGSALPFSIVAFVLSLVVLYFQFSHSKIWVDEHKDGDTMSIFEAPEE